MRDLISFQCEQCKRRNYTSTKNKKTTTEKLSLRKFCPACRTHTVHKESRSEEQSGDGAGHSCVCAPDGVVSGQ